MKRWINHGLTALWFVAIAYLLYSEIHQLHLGTALLGGATCVITIVMILIVAFCFDAIWRYFGSPVFDPWLRVTVFVAVPVFIPLVTVMVVAYGIFQANDLIKDHGSLLIGYFAICPLGYALAFVITKMRSKATVQPKDSL